MQLTNNAAEHALLILLSMAIAFLGLMMLARAGKSDLEGTSVSASNAAWHAAVRGDEQTDVDQSPIKFIPAGKLRPLLGARGKQLRFSEPAGITETPRIG